MTDPKAIKEFIFGGKAILTLCSGKTGERYTYKISKAKKHKDNPDAPYFVNLLTGPDNTANYTYIGMIHNRSKFTLTRASKMAKDSSPVIAFDWSFRCVLSGKIPATLEIWHEGRCGRCGRRLTVPGSILTGFGPECGEAVGVPIADLRPPLTPEKIRKHVENFAERVEKSAEQEAKPKASFSCSGLDGLLSGKEARAVAQLKFNYR